MDGSEERVIRRVKKMQSVQTVTVFCEETDCRYNCERVCNSTRIAIIGGKCTTKACRKQAPKKTGKRKRKNSNES